MLDDIVEEIGEENIV